jgi:hypothetical protein
MAALAGEAALMRSCRDLTWWPGPDGGWHIEWRDGPYASEVAGLLVERIGEPGLPGPPARHSGTPTATMAGLDVLGVGFALRAVDPLGRERVLARQGLWRMAASLDTASLDTVHRTAPATRRRRHWEELLGG